MDAATTLFAARGLRRARIDEIARAAGVSPGNVYNYVSGKDALFRMVMQRVLDPAWRPPQGSLPVDGPSVEETVDWVAERLDFAADFPLMEAALARRTPPRDVAGEVEGVAGELFDVLLRLRHVSLILERSAPDMPHLREMFLGVRRELFARVTRYIERRVRAGGFLPQAAPAATARLLVEAASWATRGRLYDPDPQTILPDAEIRAGLVELALRALVGER